MQEWCACGASIKARRKDVFAWRAAHSCQQSASEPDRQGAHAQVEHAGGRSVDVDTLNAEVPIVYARVGFQPNGER